MGKPLASSPVEKAREESTETVTTLRSQGIVDSRQNVPKENKKEPIHCRIELLEIEFLAKKTALIQHLKNPPLAADDNYQKALKQKIAKLQEVCDILLPIYRARKSEDKENQILAMLLICAFAGGREKRALGEADKNWLNISKRPCISTQIRETTGSFNWYRLFGLRLKRFFEALAPVTKAINGYHGFQDFVNGIDKLNPVLSYVAWLYYVPRLTINLILLLKHTIPNPSWMSKEELALNWWTRIQTECSKRWFEILNDGVWCAVGLLNCFWLATPQGMLLTVGLYLFDVGMAVVNYLKQAKKYNTLIAEVMAQRKSVNERKSGAEINITQGKEVLKNEKKVQAYEEELDCLQSYLDSLNQWKIYEVKRLKQSIFVTLGLSAGMAISAVPIIVMLAGTSLSGPWGLIIPLLAATMVLAICIAQYITSKQIAKHKPETEIKDMGNLKASLMLPREKEVSVSKVGMFGGSVKDIKSSGLWCSSNEDVLVREDTARTQLLS